MRPSWNELCRAIKTDHTLLPSPMKFSEDLNVKLFQGYSWPDYTPYRSHLSPCLIG